MKQYIITQDLEFLMNRWANANGFLLPSKQFFQDIVGELLTYLQSIFQKIEYLELASISYFVREFRKQMSGLTVVSVDQIYNNADYHLQSNRIADTKTMEILGEAERPGFPPLIDQIKMLPADKDFCLIDDGIFSGDSMINLIRLFENQGLKVKKIIVGLRINEGLENKLEKTYPGIIINSPYEFTNVIDWVCERDFFIGVPLSGRTAGYKDDNGNLFSTGIALPYCLPFGNPTKAASIPEDMATDFSKFMIQQSIKLWQEIERASGKVVTSNYIPRKYASFGEKKHFVSSLKSVKL